VIPEQDGEGEVEGEEQPDLEVQVAEEIEDIPPKKKKISRELSKLIYSELPIIFNHKHLNHAVAAVVPAPIYPDAETLPIPGPCYH